MCPQKFWAVEIWGILPKHWFCVFQHNDKRYLNYYSLTPPQQTPNTSHIPPEKSPHGAEENYSKNSTGQALDLTVTDKIFLFPYWDNNWAVKWCFSSYGSSQVPPEAHVIRNFPFIWHVNQLGSILCPLSQSEMCYLDQISSVVNLYHMKTLHIKLCPW